MSSALKPFPMFKDSGDGWLGKVPAHWLVNHLGSLTLRRSERNQPDLPLLSVLREKGVVLRSSLGEDENHNFVPDDLSNYRVARAGDLVINKMKAWQGSVGIAPVDGVVSPAYFVFELDKITKDYAHRLLRSRLYADFFARASDGVRIGQWDLNIPQMKRIPVAIPPPDEQNGIVRFLEALDRKVNRFIRNRRRLIEVLNEQKQAIIHRAVTRGLNDSTPLKPSGINWLGEVPQHWKVIRLGRIIDLLTGFPFPSSGFTHSSTDLRLLRGVNVSPGKVRWDQTVYWSQEEGLGEFTLKVGDVVLGMDRPVISSGVRVATVNESDVPSLLLQRVCRIRAQRGLRQSYVPLLLSGRSFAEYLAPIFTGISVPHISPEQIRSFRVVIPPIEEQNAILPHLATSTAGVDTAISTAEREIALIREYRTRLIADVVTGQVDVRHLAPAADKAADQPSDEFDDAQLDEVSDEAEVETSPLTEETVDG